MQQDEWGGDLPDVHAREIVREPAAEFTPQEGAEAWADCVGAVGDLNEACRALDRAAMRGVPFQVERLEGGTVVALVAMLQDVRRSLGQVESIIARTVGQDEVTPRAGFLPDGRAYEVRKGVSRKAWQHEEWKHDVRRQILSGLGEVVDAGTGETIDVSVLVAAAQAVHGSAAPKATALKALGLAADDYAETVSGSWSVQVTGGTGEVDSTSPTP